MSREGGMGAWRGATLSPLSFSFCTPPAAPEPDSRQSSFARSDPSQLLPIIWVLGFTPTGSTTCPAGASPPVTRALVGKSPSSATISSPFLTDLPILPIYGSPQQVAKMVPPRDRFATATARNHSPNYAL